ncbi:MAG: hypothetical protein HFI33_09410 [Lachnospiraceae bacterium]|nr:hypothetical protein [Lachnospiraceae bacterium]
MKKMDEMERNIQLRSEEWGYRSVLLALGVWTLYNCWQTLAKGAEYHPLPGLILCFAVCVQGFCQMGMREKMIAGDEEYREPSKLLRTIIGAVVGAVLIISLGTYLIMKV